MADIKSGENLIFVCGCGHSGTTLLWAMLSAHSRVYGIPYETAVFLNSVRNNRNSLTCIRRALVSSYNFILCKRAKIIFSSFTRTGYLSFTRTDENIISFFNDQLEEAEKINKDIICEKTPRHVLKIYQIKKIFPQSSIIVLVRNGLDVTASIKERRGNFEDAMNRWINNNRVMLDFKKNYPLHLVKYENLITNPEHELREICHFCNIKYEERMLSYYDAPSEYKWKYEGRREQIYRPLMDRRGRWKNSLTDGEITRFRKNAGDLMRFFDYEFD